MSDDMAAKHLDEIRRIGKAASVEPVAWDQPPPELWARIADAAFADEDDTETADSPPPPPIPLDAGRRRPGVRWWLASAAAAVVITVGMVVWMRPAADAPVVAAVDLERLGDVGEGSAQLVDDDGSLQLRLVADGVEAPDGFTEVWLINTDLTELISLGPIREDETYELPTGLDPTAFPIVDVSREPLDGNPAHSGDSVLRGELTF